MTDKDITQMIRKDITERLRDRDNHDCIEAAEEIERLRKELDARIAMCDMRSEKIGELTNERDEARQEICESHCDSLAVVLGSHITPQDYAQRRGWDCFKKKTLKDCLKENTNV